MVACSLHVAATREAGIRTGVGHRQNNWTDDRDLQKYESEARRLCPEEPSSRWGFKDPRTSLLLDFWDGILDDARYLLLYRFPWEVADSMQRVGADAFLGNPDFAYPAWHFYNRHLLDFYRRHQDRAVLVSTNAIPAHMEEFRGLVEDRLQVSTDGKSLKDLFEKKLFAAGGADDPRGALVSALMPDCAALLHELDEAADLSGRTLWTDSPPASAAETGTQPTNTALIVPFSGAGELAIDTLGSIAKAAPQDTETVLAFDRPAEQETTSRLRSLGYRIAEATTERSLSDSINAAVTESEADMLVVLAGGDRLAPGFVEAAGAALDEDESTGLVYGDTSLFGQRTGPVTLSRFSTERLFRGAFLDAVPAIRRKTWMDAGGYDADLTDLAPWDLWLRASSLNWKSRKVDRNGARHRVAPGALAVRKPDIELRTREFNYVRDNRHSQFFRALPTAVRSLVLGLEGLGGSLVRRYWTHRRMVDLRPLPENPADQGERDPKPEADRSTGSMPGRVLFVTGAPNSKSRLYRVENHADALRSDGVHAESLADTELDAALKEAAVSDLVILHRAPMNDNVAQIIAVCRDRGIPVGLDIDDLLFVQELMTPAHFDYLGGLDEAAQAHWYDYAQKLRETLDSCDFVITTTEALAGHARETGATTFVLPNALSEGALDRARRALKKRKTSSRNDLVRIGYASGTPTHRRDFAQISTALAQVMEQNPRAMFVALGCLDLDDYPELAPYQERIEQRPLVPYEDLPLELARFDVNLVPLEVGNPFCEAKSELKYFEAGILGIPTAASGTDVFRSVIDDGVNGRLAVDAEEWTEVLLELTSQDDKRQAMGEAARNHAGALYGLEEIRRAVRILHETIRREFSPKHS